MKKKFANKKNISLLLVGLAALSVATVGFSAWIMTGGETSASTSTITAEVSDFTDERFGISNLEVTDGAINFDCKADDQTGPITFTGEGTGEDLSFTLAFDITVGADATFGSMTLFLQPNSATESKLATYSAAGSTNYITLPIDGCATSAQTTALTSLTANTYYNQGGSDSAGYKEKYVVTTDGSDSNKHHVVATYCFGWGTVFDGKNPGDATSATDAIVAGLNAIKNADMSFTATIAITAGA